MFTKSLTVYPLPETSIALTYRNNHSPWPKTLLTHISGMDFPIIIIRVSPLTFLGASGVFFLLNFIQFSVKFLLANRIAPDGAPRFAASHLGLYCCLYPIQGTPGFNELIVHTLHSILPWWLNMSISWSRLAVTRRCWLAVTWLRLGVCRWRWLLNMCWSFVRRRCN